MRNMKDNKSAYNAGIYDEHIVNVLPYYREYHNQVIDVVRNMGMEAPAWLDSGCGTGTLAVNTLRKFPDVRFTLCDPSENMLEQAKAKLQGQNEYSMVFIPANRILGYKITFSFGRLVYAEVIQHSQHFHLKNSICLIISNTLPVRYM